MKKNHLILIITLLLATTVVYLLVFKKSNSTISEELRDFAVSDTATVTKIYLADKSNHQVTLQKVKTGEWKLNNKYAVRNDAIDMLLYTIKNIEVKSPVSKKARENVIKNLASGATKIEIYQNEKLSKVYYIGGETQDQLGTYMLLSNPETGENSPAPFIMYIPGFEGYLTTRYFTLESDWRARTIFKYIPIELKSVKLEYPQNPELGFEISIPENNKFRVTSISNRQPLSNFDTLAVKQYLSYYQDVQFEALETTLSKAVKDSIITSSPAHIITVTTLKGEKIVVKTFAKAAQEGIEDTQGNPLKYDVDRMYALINNGQDFVIIQYYTFGKLLQSIDYFKPVSSVRK